MRTVRFHVLDRDFSALGFGCASLGSTVGRAAGLRALNLALSSGVSWFDVAPNYGGGNAEILLGEALRGIRHSVGICTKISVLPPFPNPIPAFLKPSVRWMMKAAPFSWRMARSRRHPWVQQPRLTPDFIEKSLVGSLTRLKTDYVDVLALHDPYVTECSAPEIVESLRRVIEKGYARAVAIAGSVQAANEGLSGSDLFHMVQIKDSILKTTSVAERLEATLNSSPFVVTHGVLGDLYLDPRSRKVLVDSGRSLTDFAAEVLHFSFSKNPTGIVLVSMYSPEHIKRNCRVGAESPNEFVARRFAERISQAV